MASPSSTLTYTRAASDADRDGIQALFVRNGHPTFPEVYPRIYGDPGAVSYVARDRDGRVVMHLAAFVREFEYGASARRGLLVGDLMVDEPFRDFWGPLKLTRMLLADAFAHTGADFAITDPTAPSQGVVKAAGFAPFAELRRYVLPTSRSYGAVVALRRRTLPLHSRLVDPLDAEVRQALEQAPARAHFSPRRSLSFWQTRLGGPAAPQPHAVLVHDARGLAAAALLSTGTNRRIGDLLDVVAVGAPPRDDVAVVGGIVSAARRLGVRRLNVRALEHAHATAALLRAGALPRDDRQPIWVHRPRGAAPLPDAEHWLLTSLDGSQW